MIRIKSHILALMMMGIMTMPAWAVGTVNQSLAQIPGSTNYVFTENWVGDSITGSVPATVMQGTGPIQGFRIVSVEIAPGSPAPTNNYSITMTDFSGADLLGGSGATLSNTTATILPSLSNAPPIYGSMTVNVTGNSVASAQGRILVYFAPVSQVIGNTPTGANLTTNNLFTGSNTFQGTSTFTGTNTLSGPTSITGTTALNGCQYVDANQTFAAALAAASNPGCIEITPGTYPVSTNATIPSGVTLRSVSGGLLSIATSVTLTINGPIVGSSQQMFVYVGSGVAAFGTGVGLIHATWFPGADILAQAQNAYNALPAAPSGGTIFIDSNPAGGCWTATTTLSMNVANKYATLQGTQPSTANNPNPQGTCINYTPTITGSAVSISAISIAAGLVSVTCSATCTTGWTGGGSGTATIVTIRGVTGPDYNGVWPVQTVTDGTHFTFNATFGTPAASSGGTVAQSPFAIELDWTPGAGGGYATGAGLRDITLVNNGCNTNGGCGSYAVGILTARTNGGVHAGKIRDSKIQGWGTGIAKLNTPNGTASDWGLIWENNSFSWNNVGIFVGRANENDVFQGGRMAVNGTGYQLQGFGAELTILGGSIDSQTICGIQLDAGALVHAEGLHWENFGNTTTHYACSSATAANSYLDISGGVAYDDATVGTTDNWFTAGFINVNGLTIISQGRTISSALFAANTSGSANIVLANGVIPLASVAFGPSWNLLQVNGAFQPTRSMQSPAFGYAETAAAVAAAAGFEWCYGDSTAHSLKCSYNNGAFLAIPQSVQNGLVFDGVYGTYRVTTDQTITAGASLTNIPGLSWTFPANTALNVKFTCDLLYSQATAAASDSFGFQDVTVAPTNAETYGRADTSTTAFTAGNTDAAGVTTAVTTVTFTPSAATTVFGAHIDGLIEQPSNASTSAFNIMAQFTTNNGTIKRGSSCQVF